MLTVENAGRRRFRGQIRDAWPQAPGRAAHPYGEYRGGKTNSSDHRAAPGPPRRSTFGAGHRAFGGTARVGRAAEFAPGALADPDPAALPVRKHLPSRLAKLRELDGTIPVLIRGQGTEFDSLREYVVGDDVGPSTGAPPPGAPTLWCAPGSRARPAGGHRAGHRPHVGRAVGVDPTASDPGGWPRLDWSMDAALLLATLASRAGDHVDFLAHDRVTRAGVFNASRTELLAQLVEAMAPLQPALVESDAAPWSRRCSGASGRALVVLLTDLNASALDEGLMGVLPQLSAKHHVLLAAVADPRVDRLAAGRADAAQVCDAAAAERARNDRRTIASRLRHGGVDVVDAAPEELAPALADRYLAMKATGRM